MGDQNRDPFPVTQGHRPMKAHDYVDFHAQHQPNAEFAVDSRHRWTYREARNRANRVAHALLAAGLNPGDRIAVVMKNRVETAILYLGAFKTGIVATPINHRLQPTQWLEICDDAEVKLIVCDAQAADAVDTIRSQLRTVRHFILDGVLLVRRGPSTTNGVHRIRSMLRM